MSDAYHHGNLRTALMERALAIVVDRGVDALTIRGLAADLGVSHTAPLHHFPSRRALLTALAAEGFAAFADALEAAEGDFLAQGMAHLRFALAHPAHVEVMFSPDLHDPDDPALAEAGARALHQLRTSAGVHHPDAEATALAGWSLIHGFAALARSGALHKAGFVDEDTDLVALGTQVARMLAGGPRP